ncbi:GDP-fucose protein O-fucosyltransferase protein [Dioscorea alata]|uniref:GDP-fucose protein O-fucosyltransferase protein n=4 Tax=Dioscorea alata TaxID=55571 RepID=A0ACB7WJD7_DIOAL|nr:GDP-fucose protein O-fucosyltransferase protein [Dioscorea alata]KAH7688062.1 GDP-fucose protein O-fucosyltransferase protein [Dioscorea alata]KAH7688063.1 GDP-fucose protein O-fucosyltransferase protein [Dioscorea alata]KAH7688064.1 GDP-fucose protein O-fucosyltransferase protein [Dioscorea alata]
MAVDPRQVLAGFLTISMFVLLGNMIKQDHFDSVEDNISQNSDVQISVVKIEQEADVLPMVKGPWEENSQELKPCWTRPSPNGAEESNGYITFSLKSGPEYHMSQVADAVVIARYLRATLVLPDIRGSVPGQKRNFQDMYDVEKFLNSMDGIVKITKEIPAEIATGKPAVVRVPNRVTEDFIVKEIEPIFQTKGYLRLATSFPSINLRLNDKQNDDLDTTTCLAMFGSLELKTEIQDVAEQMVLRLQTLSHKSDGKFIAVDLRVDVLEKKGCKEAGGQGRQSCYSAQEVGDFLKKIGFDGDATIYLTQTWWHESLNPLKDMFPKTYTKDDIMPPSKKGEFLLSGNVGLEKALDLYVCSQSDVFVPAISGMFYGSITGKRIASGRSQILVPAQISGSSASASDFISSYVTMKNHVAYSCYC